MKRALGLGEIMVQMNPTEKGALRFQSLFERHVAGSEANTIIQMQRLGIECSFLSAVGADEFGKVVIDSLRLEGVDTDGIVEDKTNPTAVYFVQRSYPVPDKTMVFYYRKGSAAANFGPDNLRDELFEGVDLFLVSGITPALSESCNDAALKSIELAKKHGAQVAFDTNIRINLLKTRENAMNTLDPFIREADILFTGAGDLTMLFGDDMERAREEIVKKAQSADIIVFKNGSDGVEALVGGKSYSMPSYKVPVIDELGAGDACDGAFLASYLQGKSIEDSLRYANVAGAITVSLKGDIEPLPDWQAIETFLNVYGAGEKRLLR
ncbi:MULTISPECIES: sugar kinase [unclassified Mesotoga]|uniref:sugar kinase n=2 Tax=Mesotoga TaxID=1184396 RepID=UPI000EF215F9|nr:MULTISPECIES: sugar kinase [unclassified Mesotoga]MDI9367098.1 sugar kinase [Thermotogota bacterium]NLT44879.1 sugar kinase [Thermotogaceae bacterium]MDD3680949.1 sugar kinase [Mesotoga sp.]MDD4206318.1 sugar kinase [Mesotoga sp.]MDD4825687.1 sugar kinase [Mesotoga sp.]